MRRETSSSARALTGSHTPVAMMGSCWGPCGMQMAGPTPLHRVLIHGVWGGLQNAFPKCAQAMLVLLLQGPLSEGLLENIAHSRVRVWMGAACDVRESPPLPICPWGGPKSPGRWCSCENPTWHCEQLLPTCPHHLSLSTPP